MSMMPALPTEEALKLAAGPTTVQIDDMWPPGSTYRDRYGLGTKSERRRNRASRPRRESRDHKGTVLRNFATARGRN